MMIRKCDRKFVVSVAGFRVSVAISAQLDGGFVTSWYLMGQQRSPGCFALSHRRFDPSYALIFLSAIRVSMSPKRDRWCNHKRIQARRESRPSSAGCSRK